MLGQRLLETLVVVFYIREVRARFPSVDSIQGFPRIYFHIVSTCRNHQHEIVWLTQAGYNPLVSAEEWLSPQNLTSEVSLRASVVFPPFEEHRRRLVGAASAYPQSCSGASNTLRSTRRRSLTTSMPFFDERT